MSMETLKQNITSLHGPKGAAWIASLDATVEERAKLWQLSQILPVPNMSWHYVARALSPDHGPVCLKIGCDGELMQREWLALRAFQGYGAVEVLDYDPALCALLLRCAVPGITLKALFDADEDRAITVYGRAVNALFGASDWPDGAQSVQEWLNVFHRVDESKLPHGVLARATHLSVALLNIDGAHAFLHGDLHMENILQNDRTFVVIDPKGIVGPKGFEVAAFDFLKDQELSPGSQARAHFERRVTTLSALTGVSPQTLRDWVYVRLVLAASWCLEDKADPDPFLKRVQVLF
ncbi:MAG: hypothetical protein C0514_05990 [Candidatus Puniceispirillum sp.]|nr:hypothetical protein [Candidatus Puniceispirillum sp.]